MRKIAIPYPLPTGKYDLLLIVAVVTVLRVTWLGASPLPLYGDEAQYWTWAKALDWGYYSKPPLVGWVIALTTLLSDGEFWVRLGSPLAHGMTALVVGELGRRMFDARTGFWAGVAYLTLPAVFLSSTLISTDPFLLLFWALGLLGLWQGMQTGRWAGWVLCGGAVGMGLLAKYAAVAFWPSCLLALALVPEYRRWLRSRQLWAAVGISVLVLLPNIIWNAQHGFVTFLHTRDNADLNSGVHLHVGDMLEFAGSQFGVMGPVLFGVLLFLFWGLRRLEPRLRFLAAFALPILFFMTVLALVSRANANWAAVAYTSATLLVVAWLVQREWVGWVKASVVLHSVVAGAVLALPFLLPSLPVDPFRRLKEPHQLVTQVLETHKQVPDAAILSDDRMLTAIFMYYGRDGLPGVVKWNPAGHVTDYYEMTTHVGQFKDYLLVTEGDGGQVAAGFAKAERLADVVTGAGRKRKTYQVWVLEGIRD